MAENGVTHIFYLNKSTAKLPLKWLQSHAEDVAMNNTSKEAPASNMVLRSATSKQTEVFMSNSSVFTLVIP